MAEKTNENVNPKMEGLTDEQLAQKRKDITEVYEENIPHLKTHLEYEELLKDIEDHKGDCNSGINTFPVCFGINHSLRLFLLLTILLLGWAGFLPFFMELNLVFTILFWGLFSPWIFYIMYLLFWKNILNIKQDTLLWINVLLIKYHRNGYQME